MLAIILFEATGCADNAKLNAQLLKDIFHSFGEDELADDDKLIQDMIVVAMVWVMMMLYSMRICLYTL